ncbi:MAG: ABC transporter ATP-binding protein [Woeseiaceae bacterium]
MTDAPLIDIRNATIYRGDTCVFENLNLTIEQHQPAVVLGPNGSGKTTLLKTINRELYPVHRKDSWVRILGQEKWNVWKLRSQIGIVSHDLQTRYPGTTTGLSVVLSGYLSSIGIHGSLADRIDKNQAKSATEIMHELGVAAFAHTPLRQMSTGQQRRCLLARALVHNPHTLILDEPTAGLDLAAAFDYMKRIRQLASQGRNIVLVTHLLNEIPPDIDRVILLRKGTIMADGPKREVLSENHLRKTYDVDIRVAEVDGYYLGYPPDS